MTATTERLFDPVESLTGIKVIDVDTHLTEPGDLWTSRAPRGMENRVPRVISSDQLTESMRTQATALGMMGIGANTALWVVDTDTVLGPAGAGSVINRHNEKIRGSMFLEWPMSECSAAASFVEPRVAMMDQLGISAQVMYPNVVGFGAQNFFRIEDPTLRLLCATLWNDAMAEMQEQSNGRICGMALIPWWDIDASVKEIERVAAMGLKGVITNADPQNQGFPDLGERVWDPVWEALSSLGLPLNFHCGASATQRSYFGTTPWPSLDNASKLALGTVMLQLGNARTIGNVIYAGFLDRFPTLKVVSVESGIGWVPYMLDGLDYHASESQVDGLSMLPSEYFRRQMAACFWFESGPRLIEDIKRVGVDNCMFETDFPHPTCLFPEPLRHIEPTLRNVDDTLRRKVLSENAARIYNFDLDSLVDLTS